jgi:acyl-CoA dehydrogenase
MAKLVANEAARLICDEALQLHGRDGYWHGHVVAQRYRDARGLLLLDGTPEDMRNVIAASTLGGTPADAP